ncbi:MAG: 3-phosphoshikimate 1-carboxyvinyltransferase [Armatimonadota bacterium]|nr:3-phosphoshikimate 1-carboxyvinyltransferase [Armatimonadota bacterium]MDR5696632.1 3-phosphoshikimate 1-carboxyvinyltransferase [Armatimonadota bacterium]
MTVSPARIRGRLRVPADKSISHRAVLLGAIAQGVSVARNFLVAADTLRSVACVRALGVDAQLDGTTLRVGGRGLRGLRAPTEALDAGNSGTTIRLLCGVLAGQPFEAILTGDDSIRRRPMDRVVTPLREMGARIEAQAGGLAPLRVRGGALRPIRHRMPIPSAQVKSAILLAGLYADGETTVVEPQPSRDHTERMLRAMGVQTGVREVPPSSPGAEGPREVWVRGVGRIEPVEMGVPGDPSSAAFFWVAAAAQPGGEVVVEDVGLNPARTGVLDALRAMGAAVDVREVREVCGELVGTVAVRGLGLRATAVAGALVPRLIDEIPALAVAAAVAEGDTIIRDAAELRVKESDRIEALVSNLRAIGVDCTELPDGLVVHGGRIRGGRVRSAGDHRIAMAFAVAGLLSERGVTIDDVACVATSFPGFAQALTALTGGRMYGA